MWPKTSLLFVSYSLVDAFHYKKVTLATTITFSFFRPAAKITGIGQTYRWTFGGRPIFLATNTVQCAEAAVKYTVDRKTVHRTCGHESVSF